ncbi:MAG TPA: dTMP kinase [Blastocatellia bacterium]|nr:dTMP kinase [Blastocatellia bacterium]
MKRGKFITFEGIDGCGKTTQLRLFERYLNSRNIPFISTREPGGTELGMKIRAALLNVSQGHVEPLAELLLYSADRAQHVRELVLPSLEEGRVVLSDRYADATVAYQGYGRGFDLKLINELTDLATGGLKPNLTLIFDLDVAVGLKRVHRRGDLADDETEDQADRLDREPLEFHERVRRGYLELAGREPARFRIIPAAGSIDVVRTLVIDAVRDLFE